MVVGVLPAEEGGAGGAAKRIGDEAVAERRPIVYQFCLQYRHVFEGIDILIVGYDENDVGPSISAGDQKPPTLLSGSGLRSRNILQSDYSLMNTHETTERPGGRDRHGTRPPGHCPHRAGPFRHHARLLPAEQVARRGGPRRTDTARQVRPGFAGLRSPSGWDRTVLPQDA